MSKVSWIIAVCIFISSLALNAVFIDAPLEGRCGPTGNGLASINALTAGKNFNKVGFSKLSFVSSHARLLTGTEPANEIQYYTHYPPGPEIFQGLLYRAGLTSEKSHRIFSLMLTYVSAVIALLVFKQLFPPTPALIGWGSYVLSPLFFFYADNLQHSSLIAIIYWSYFLFLIRLRKLLSTSAELSFTKYFWGLFAVGLVVSWISIDGVFPTLFLTLILVGSRPLTRNKFAFSFLLLAPFLGELVGTVLHLMQNSLVLGGFSEAVADFIYAGKRRAGLLENYSLFLHMGRSLLILQWFYTIPLFVTAVAGWFLTLEGMSRGKKLSLFIASFVGAIFWPLFMRNHSLVHLDTYSSFAGFVFLGVAAFASKALSRTRALWLAMCLIFGALHYFMAVYDLDFIRAKRAIIPHLVTLDRLPEWAHAQYRRGSLCRSRDEIRSLLSEWLAPGGDSFKVGPLDDVVQGYDTNKPTSERVAELILYLR